MTENSHYLKGVSFLYKASFAQLIAQSLRAICIHRILTYDYFFINIYIGSYLISCVAFLFLILTARNLARWRENFNKPFILTILGSSGYFVIFLSFLSERVFPLYLYQYNITGLMIFLAFLLMFLGYIGLILILLNLLSGARLKSLKIITAFIVIKLFIICIFIFEAIFQIFLEQHFYGYTFELEFLSAIVSIWIWNLVAISVSRILALKECFERVEERRHRTMVLEDRIRECEEYLARLQELHERGEVSNEVYVELRNLYREQMSRYREELEKLREKLEESGATTVMKR